MCRVSRSNSKPLALRFTVDFETAEIDALFYGGAVVLMHLTHTLAGSVVDEVHVAAALQVGILELVFEIPRHDWQVRHGGHAAVGIVGVPLRCCALTVVLLKRLLFLPGSTRLASS